MNIAGLRPSSLGGICGLIGYRERVSKRINKDISHVGDHSRL